MKFLLLVVLAFVAQASALAAPCTPAPLGERELFLRGTMNGWRAEDAQAFRYRCDHYELVTAMEGDQSFKIGGEDWSPDSDWGGAGVDQPLQAKGGALQRRFAPGLYRVSLRFDAGVPRLSIEACSDCSATTGALPVLPDARAAEVRFDSRSLADKGPFGAVTEGSIVRFAIHAPRAVEQATLVIERRRLEGNEDLIEYQPLARIAMQRTRDGWQARYRFETRAIYGYHFEFTLAGKRYVLENNREPVYWTREKGTMGAGLVEAAPADAKRLRRFRQTVYASDFTVPAWARDAVYYYIFPERYRNGDRRNDPRPGMDRYQNQTVELHKDWNEKPFKPGSGDGSDAVYNNDFFGGDLAGIIEKLDDIRDLGANTIYMTPIWQAASNHKYDTADYRSIDPHFGTEADFERLCAEAAKRGIRVIPDASLNHVGSDSVYFNRYGNFGNQGAFEGGKPNPASPWADWFTLDASKTETNKQYKGWAGTPDLPELNKASPSFRAFAYGKDGVMQHWLNRGAAGWRMDVAPWVPDDFWREWRKAVKASKPDALTISEAWFDSSKFFLGDEFDSTMNYIFRNALLDYAGGGDARKLAGQLELMREAYPPQALYALMNLLSSHDVARSLHVLGYHDDGDAAALSKAKQRMLLALLFQMSYPGSPAIYYGDEVGVAGGDDPYNRATYPWPDEGGKPDLDLRAQFKRIVQLRNQLPVLRHGSIAAPLFTDEHVIALLRRDGKTAAITITNNAEIQRSVALQLPRDLAGASLTDALDGSKFKVGADRRATFTLPPMFGRLLMRD